MVGVIGQTVAEHIGIVGGSFDPPHYAHLILAEHAHEELQLGRVLFVPAGAPPHKGHTRVSVEHRMTMLHLAIADNPAFDVSRVDVDRPGPHYSIDMVNLLRDQYPGCEFTYVMGEDMFKDLPNWSRAEGLFTDGRLKVAVMRRLGSKGVLRPDAHDDTLPGLAQNVAMLESPLIEISSTDIVRRLREGLSARYLLPESVLSYIQEHKLYR